MADEKGNEGELEIDNAGKKKKMIIIIAAVVILLGGGAGGYFFFMGGSDPAPSSVDNTPSEGNENGEAEVVESGAKQGSALYVPMPRPFRFNVPGASRDRFVEIRVQLLVRGGDNLERAKMHIPLIESTLLGVFSRANADDLATSAGKLALKQQALSSVQEIMKSIEANKTVEKVLFTGFVMQ